MDERKLRPPFCFDKTCQVLLSTYNEEDFDKGYSFFCFGKLKEGRTFKDKEAVHWNDISHCYYTPLKGMLRFFMNKDDLWGEAQAKLRVLNKLIEVKCPDCGEKMSKVIRHECFNPSCAGKKKEEQEKS